MKKLIFLCFSMVFLCGCTHASPAGQISFFDARGTWCFLPSGDLLHVSQEKVYLAEDMSTYSVFLSDQSWGIQHTCETSIKTIYEEPLLFDGDPLGRPVRQPPSSGHAELLLVGNWLVFYVLDRDTNSLHLCKVHKDGSDFYEWSHFEFRGDPLFTDGSMVYSICKNPLGDYVPFQINPETNQGTERSATPANVRDQLWLNAGKLWWISLQDNTTLLCAVPLHGGETAAVSVAPNTHIQYVGMDQIFFTEEDGSLCSWHIETAERTCWDETKDISWAHILGCNSQGLLLGTEDPDHRIYWFLDFQSGKVEQVF